MRSLNNSIKILIINLKRSADRREAISKNLDALNLQYEFVDAIDGIDLSKDFIEKVNNQPGSFKTSYGRDMTLGETGASLSHLKTYQLIVEKKYSFSLVLEDDAGFDERLKIFLEKISENTSLQKNFDLVLLGYCRNDLDYHKQAVCSFWGNIKIDQNFKVGIPVFWYWSAIGYLITGEGAQKLLTHGKLPRMPADFLTANSPKYNLRLGIIGEPIIWPGELDKHSTIGERSLPVSGDIGFNERSQRSRTELIKKKIKKNAGIFFTLREKFKLFRLRISRRKYLFVADKY